MATLNTSVCDVAIKDVKFRKARYAVFKVKNDNSQIIITVDCIHTQRTDGYKALLKDLPDTQPRYILYDYEFKTAHYDSVGGSGRATSSILLIYWNPDNASQHDRMLYSTAKNVLSSYLTGVKHEEAKEEEDIENLLSNESIS